MSCNKIPNLPIVLTFLYIAATSSFGGGAGMLGGGLNANQAGSGTANPPFSPYVEKDLSSGQNSHYQSITAMPAYRNFSFEVRSTTTYRRVITYQIHRSQRPP